MYAKPLNRITWKESPAWLRWLGVCVIANFAAFWIVAVLLGGDAVNGKVVDGHYFLRNHGQLREVSEAVFVYSKIHCLTAMAGIAILLIAIVQYNARKPR